MVVIEIGESFLLLLLLPIELISFEATLEDNDVLITWITATEVNNEYFFCAFKINR